MRLRASGQTSRRSPRMTAPPASSWRPRRSSGVRVDVDPDAIEVAREVSARNGADPRLEWSVGSATDEPAGAWDAVVANISETYFLRDADAIALDVKNGLAADDTP